ncbi:MAG: efflux RND transporter periplasmic adaptor subunit [Gemmatimonadaceae bacterium]
MSVLLSVPRATVGALVLVAACSPAKVTTRPPANVKVATAQVGSAPYIVPANGIVEPVRTVAIQSQVGGVLKSVRFKEGTEVKEGDVLFEVDPVPFAAALRQAEALLARDEAQFRNATRDAERYAALAQKDFVTRSQADQAAANAEALRSVVDADHANVETARFNLDNATIRAPVSGKTGSLLVREGNLVRPGTNPPLVVINQIHPILVRFAVPDRELPSVQQYSRGRSLPVSVVPRGDAKAVAGVLDFVDNGVDTTTGTVTLKARFDNADGRLWPGQFVAVSLVLHVDSNVVLVPNEAVMNGQDGPFVYIVDGAKKAQMQRVTIARVSGDQTIIATGVSSGATVVTDGQSRLTPGAEVELAGAGSKAAAEPARSPAKGGTGGRSSP